MRYNAQDIVAKWSDESSKLSVHTIADEKVRQTTAQILENITQYEGDRVDMGKFLMEDQPSSLAPSSQATGQWSPIALALARRVVPDLFAWKCVGVQPMNGPVGLAYATRFFYNGTQKEATFDDMDSYSGYSGSTSGTSGTYDAGTGVSTATAEAWNLGVDMPQLTFAMVSTAVTAKSRKLAADISLETIMDVRAMQNVDVKKEMVTKLHAQTVSEIDREILGAMKTAAVNTAAGGAAVTTWQTSASDGVWQGQKYSTVANAIIAQANNIGNTTRVAPANFVVVSTRVASILQAVPVIFTAHNLSVPGIGRSSLTNIGTLNGSIEVYVDRYANVGGAANKDYALVGLNGGGDNEYGIIYSPYVMGLESEATGPLNFSNRVGVMQRYAITNSLLGTGRFYRLTNFENLTSMTLI